MNKKPRKILRKSVAALWLLSNLHEELTVFLEHHGEAMKVSLNFDSAYHDDMHRLLTSMRVFLKKYAE